MPKKPTVSAERITDKERLDWIEQNGRKLDPVPIYGNRWNGRDGKFSLRRDTEKRRFKTYDDLRGAIDAAMKAERRAERRKPKGRKPQ